MDVPDRVTEAVAAGQAARPRRRFFDGAGLGADLRAAAPDASAALVLTGLIFWWLYARVESGDSATTEVMPFLADAPEYWMYWLCQAFGWSGLLWAWITMMLGLLRSGARPAWMPVSVARLERWHRTTSLTTIGLMFGHAFMFFAELVRDNGDELPWARRITGAFGDSFVPGVYDSGTGEIAILLGLLAFYLAIPLGLAYYLRRGTGPRLWRALHRFIVVVYVLSVWHTLLYGTNVWYDGAFRTTVWALQLPVAALFLARLTAPARRAERLRAADRSRGALAFTARLGGRALIAATLLALLAVTVSGRDGGRPHKGKSAEPFATVTSIWIGLGALLLAVTVTVVRLYRARPAPQAAPTRDNGGPGPHGEHDTSREPGEPDDRGEPAAPGPRR